MAAEYAEKLPPKPACPAGLRASAMIRAILAANEQAEDKADSHSGQDRLSRVGPHVFFTVFAQSADADFGIAIDMFRFGAELSGLGLSHLPKLSGLRFCG